MTNPYEATSAISPSNEAPSPVANAPWLVLFAGLSLLPFVWMAVSFERGNPTWWKPFPLIPIVSVFLLKSKVMAFLVYSTFVLGSYTLSCRPLLSGPPRPPKITLAVFLVLHGINGLYLLLSIPAGIRHLGRPHTAAVFGGTGVLFAGLLLIAFACLRQATFLRVLAFQWLAWFWLVSYAFPLMAPLFTLV